MEDYLNMHDLTLSDTMQLTGLQLHDVGRSYFLLRGAQLSYQQHFDLRLRVNGDLTQYQELRRLMTRMFGDSDLPRQSTTGNMATQYYNFTFDAPDGADEWLNYWQTPNGWNDWYDYDDAVYYDGQDWHDDEFYDAWEEAWHDDGNADQTWQSN